MRRMLTFVTTLAFVALFAMPAQAQEKSLRVGLHGGVTSSNLSGDDVESGSTSALEGMRRSIVKLQPRLTFPGHAQELGHDYVPGYPASRVPYAWPLEVMDMDLPGDVHVLAWGERYQLRD